VLCVAAAAVVGFDLTGQQVQRLSKELGQQLFGQHVKSFEASTLT